MTKQKRRHCQVCNIQLDSEEGINTLKEFVVSPKHLDQELPEVFYDPSVKRLYFCSMKCLFDQLMEIWEKSKKMSVEQKPKAGEEDKARYGSAPID